MFLTSIIVIIFLILYIKIAISMLNSRKERKELEKDGNIAGIMLLSIIPAAVIGNVPYVGDVINGFSPILFIGAFIVYYRKKPGGALPPDPLDKKYSEDLLDAESTFNEVRDRWHAFLGSIEFGESLSPDGALDMVRSIRELKSKIRTRDRLDSRIVRMKEDIKSVKDLSAVA